MSRQSDDRRGGGYSSMRDILAKEQVGAAASYLELPKDTQLFKLKPGIMYIDVIPFIAGKDNPNASEGMKHWERTFWVHNGIGVDNSKVLCAAKTFGEKCPICEFREANASKAARDEDVYEQIKALEPKKRQLFNVIDTKAPDKGIQIWNESYHLFGKDLYSEVRNADERDHWDEFYYLKNGWTLKIGVEERSYNRRSFSAVDTIHFRERDKDYPDEMAEDAPCLDDCLIVPDYDDLKKTFLQSGSAAAGDGGRERDRDRGGDREERRGSRRDEREEKDEPRGRKRDEREERGGRDRDRGEGREERSERRGRRDEKDEAPPREERSERRSRRDEKDEPPREEREPDRSDRRRSRRDDKDDKDDKGKDDPWANRKGGKDKEPEPEGESRSGRGSRDSSERRRSSDTDRGDDRRRDDPEDRPRVRSDEDSESRRERSGRRDERDEPPREERGRDRDDDRGGDRDDRNRNPKDWGEFEGRRKC